MGALAIAHLSLQEYLHNTEYEHCEYWDGQAFEINLGSKKHSRIQGNLALSLGLYFRANPIGYFGPELRCKISVGREDRFRLPDLCAVLNDPSPNSSYLERSPDFVVEIKSPDDTITMLFAKMEEYLAAGTKLAWLVFPDEQSIFVFRPSQSPHVVFAGQQIDGGDILPGLSISLGDIFPSS